MNMWDYLAIEKTKDAALIQDAYAKLRRAHYFKEDQQGLLLIMKAVKEYANVYASIEDSPDSYKQEMLLEMAFERYCREKSPKTAALQGASEIQIEESITKNTGIVPAADQAPRAGFYGDFFAQMQSLYNNFMTRIEIGNWESLLHQSSLWNSTNRPGLESMIQEFLLAHHKTPSAVWQIFDNEYHWCDRISETMKENSVFARCLLIETCSRWKLGYSFIKGDSAFDYENYVEFRRLTREAALENDIDLVRENYHRATAIYNLDPDIYEVAADFYMSQSSSYKNGEFADEYIEALDKVIEFHVNDGKYILARADFHRSREEYKEARRDFSLAMKIYPDDLWIPFEIACNIQQEITSAKRRSSYVFEDYGDFVGEKNISSQAKSCLRIIRKTYPQAKTRLEEQLISTENHAGITKKITDNEKIIVKVNEALKFRFDLVTNGRLVLYSITLIAVIIIIAQLFFD